MGRSTLARTCRTCRTGDDRGIGPNRHRRRRTDRRALLTYASTTPPCHACRAFSLDIMLAPKMLRILTVLALSCGLAAGPARAQFWGAPLAPAPRSPAQAPARPPWQAPVPAQPAGPPQPPPQEQPAPYDRDLQRLSEILGALHFLRGICNNTEGQKWRNEAQALIDVEASAGDRHHRLGASHH